MSTMPAVPLRTGSGFTVEDWLALPDDGQRYELIDGALHVTPAPASAHQVACTALWSALAAAVPPDLTLRVYGMGVASPESSPAQALVPDVLVARRAALAEQRRCSTGGRRSCGRGPLADLAHP